MNALRRQSPRSWSPSTRHKVPDSDSGQPRSRRHSIRNFSARNHLRAMKKGEEAFFYHTGKERTIVGIVKVIAEAHPDSTDSAWRAATSPR
jgi:predicted RNA-binding protein with PUA-like domain